MHTSYWPRGGDLSRTQLLIRRLWTALEAIEGRRFTNQELSTYLHLSDSALSDWAARRVHLRQAQGTDFRPTPQTWLYLRGERKISDFPAWRFPRLTNGSDL